MASSSGCWSSWARSFGGPLVLVGVLLGVAVRVRVGVRVGVLLAGAVGGSVAVAVASPTPRVPAHSR